MSTEYIFMFALVVFGLMLVGLVLTVLEFKFGEPKAQAARRARSAKHHRVAQDKA